MNVYICIARIHIHDLLHCGITGCHNAELQTHTQRDVTYNEYTAMKVENIGWLILTADFGTKFTLIHCDSALDFLPIFHDNSENLHAGSAWLGCLAFCVNCT